MVRESEVVSRGYDEGHPTRTHSLLSQGEFAVIVKINKFGGSLVQLIFRLENPYGLFFDEYSNIFKR